MNPPEFPRLTSRGPIEALPGAVSEPAQQALPRRNPPRPH
jgi:hypothetical protein